MDGTTSGGGVHSTRVNAALLAAESQHMHQSRRKRIKGLPMSSEPPVRPAERPNRAVRRRWRRGRIKLEARKVNRTETSGNVHLGCKCIAQPPRNSSKRPKRLYGDVRRHRRRGRIKIEPIKVNPAQDLEKTYLERASAAQPPRNDPKCSYRVIGLGRW